MTFDWAEYLNVAGELAAIPFRPSIAEAKQRSAISRAYYAAFGKARVHLRDIDGDGIACCLRLDGRAPPSEQLH